MNPAIEVIGLSYRYPDGTLALDGVEFSIERSTSVALLGPNGAGKSTLLLHLNGLLGAKGSVSILGKKVEEANLPWVRERVGLVFQDPEDQLFMPSLWEDVAFGPRNLGLSNREVEENTSWALKVVGLSEMAEKCPHNLSFGQKKRAALASVLSMKPEVLVLDEPTSNLDPRSKEEVISLICDLKKKGTTILTAIHDVNIVPRIADQVLLLDRRVVELGPAREVLVKRGLLKGLGLDLPTIPDLFCTLKDDGYEIGDIPFTTDEALAALAGLIEK
ncbi:MAG: ATP-binding cassette domain-containing protein [Methanothrix sp.]|jgi:cobalt/nickel transport system ATP-binding protein|uniref:ABC transporter ATP-binding protein n=1 Tax=Methanothrix harundinacea TaxID=301375 RepID=A0A117MBC5_9EURY|nr:MAG: Cobalt ABC transporter, ATP-binding protein [Methanothrix harundinacea]KUK94584.1 MAG: Cobalt ABC transporter, ATP-binding protein [Methanothrix harundinacea]MCP1391577.1 ATP-binding cassette domain-containing protein [Methanothrix harundinacea]MDD2637908.1 ATP-binding cassette domain-containing protein [Methanothrix sp.]MDD3709602.1 ATP-binding cassette domain-containing protein [Methanothrix sp.]